MGYAYTTKFILCWNPYQNFYMIFQEIHDSRWRVEEVHARLMVKATFLFADDRMVESKDPVWFQLAFDTLTGLFDRVGIQTNIHTIVRMMYRPCRASNFRVDKAYIQQMIGEGRSFKER